MFLLTSKSGVRTKTGKIDLIITSEKLESFINFPQFIKKNKLFLKLNAKAHDHAYSILYALDLDIIDELYCDWGLPIYTIDVVKHEDKFKIRERYEDNYRNLEAEYNEKN